MDCPGGDIAGRVADAVGEQPDFVAVAGGDGTIRGVAQQLLGTGVPLLPIPGGTRNHFALAVGVTDLETAAKAAAGGVVRHVDVGDVNGHCFLNNSSVGLYPRLVVRRESYERRMSKQRAQLAAAWEQIRRGHRFRLELRGQWHRAWLVFVGNGCYGEHVLDFTDRESVGGGVLDIRVVLADRPLARTRVVLALLRGLDTLAAHRARHLPGGGTRPDRAQQSRSPSTARWCRSTRRCATRSARASWRCWSRPTPTAKRLRIAPPSSGLSLEVVEQAADILVDGHRAGI